MRTSHLYLDLAIAFDFIIFSLISEIISFVRKTRRLRQRERGKNSPNWRCWRFVFSLLSALEITLCCSCAHSRPLWPHGGGGDTDDATTASSVITSRGKFPSIVRAYFLFRLQNEFIYLYFVWLNNSGDVRMRYWLLKQPQVSARESKQTKKREGFLFHLP